jgi:hypothetical protein
MIAMFTAPFRFPPDFLAAFGYRAGRRFVALFWEPSGDEACYHDGLNYACGACDNWLYLDFMRRPEVRRWLDENGINLGSSDEAGQHWLIVDSLTGEVRAAPGREALLVIRCQQFPDQVNDQGKIDGW